MRVAVDGRAVASLSRRESARVPVDPGPRVLTAEIQGMPLPPVEIDVAEQESVAVDLWMPAAILFDLHHATIRASVRGVVVPSPAALESRRAGRQLRRAGRWLAVVLLLAAASCAVLVGVRG